MKCILIAHIMELNQNKTIGVIGQGWVGKNFADELENRGYKVIRYAKEKPYDTNKDAIASCSIVFIAVPTPTVHGVIDVSIVREVLRLIGKGNTAVVKSTILPGTTEELQKEFKDIYVVHSPEFLREKHAAQDVANPERNIIGIPHVTEEYEKIAADVMSVLPKSKHSHIVQAKEAELIKYAGNIFLYTKIVYMNIFFDLARSLGVSYDVVREIFSEDSRIGGSHTFVLDEHGGRGAGGHCFIKDFHALEHFIQMTLPDDRKAIELMKSLGEKNNELLRATGKDLDLLESVEPSK